MPTETRSVRNLQNRPMTVWLEPQAIDFVLQPGQELCVVGTGDRTGTWEVVEYPHCTAIYVPVTVDLNVFVDQQRILEWPRFSEDEMPGPPVRQIVEGLFGGPGGPRNVVQKPALWVRLRRWWCG